MNDNFEQFEWFAYYSQTIVDMKVTLQNKLIAKTGKTKTSHGLDFLLELLPLNNLLYPLLHFVEKILISKTAEPIKTLNQI